MLIDFAFPIYHKEEKIKLFIELKTPSRWV